MTGWTSDDLERIGGSTELQLASRRPDELLSAWTTMSVVRAGDALFVRSAYGPDSAWYRRARTAGEGRIRVGRLERDASFRDVPPTDIQIHAAVDAAYHSKYDRYGPDIVGTVVGSAAATVTMRLEPHR